jgi:uncharacterized protein YkwD
VRSFAIAAPLCVFVAACTTATSSGDTGGSNSSSSSSGSGGDSGDDAVLADARAYNLAKVNQYRAQAGVAPLHADAALDAFAQAASTELSQDHASHKYFADHATTCACGVMAENQGAPGGWIAGPIHAQIDQVLDLMMSEGPGGGHHDDIVSPKATRLGVGIVNPGGTMYFTNDFGN